VTSRIIKVYPHLALGKIPMRKIVNLTSGDVIGSTK